MTIAERAFRLLLCAYPARFLAEYRCEMLLCFRDQRRDGTGRGFRFWISLCADTVRGASREWRAFFTDVPYAGERKMKPMALLVIMVGAVNTINAIFEISIGGLFGRGTAWGTGLALATLSALFMLVAGIALLRRGREATSLAMAAGIGSMCVFAYVGIMAPILSRFAMILGLGFPLVLLVFLFAERGKPQIT